MLFSELLRLGALAAVSRQVGNLQYRVNVTAAREALTASIPYYVSSVAMSLLGNRGLSVLGYIRRDEREVGWFASIQNIVILCLILMPIIAGVFMPLVSRAFARSEEEGMAIVRRGIEALIVVIAPLTIMVSAGSDVLVALAFGPKFAPAALGLSILSLVFVLTYLDSMLGMALTILNRGWSVTIISVASVFVTGAAMFVFVPLARRTFGTGGECAGAAVSMIISEVVVAASMISRFEQSPLDARTLRTVAKSAVIGLVVILINRRLHDLVPGRTRLAIDALVYLVGALVLQVVRIGDLRRVYQAMRSRGESGAIPAPAASTRSL
jgi:O-antigen/teichoic acid export membrane protein